MSSEKEAREVKKVDIVIDLETLGLTPGSSIIALGAAVVNPEQFNKEDTYFYTTVAKESCEFYGLTADQATLIWWSKQSAAARLEVFSAHSGIADALLDFSAFVRQFEAPRLWGNAASFDLKILEAAYKACKIPVPWGYRQEMCYRTLKAVMPWIEAPKPLLAHKAIDDARAEAIHLAEMLKHLNKYGW